MLFRSIDLQNDADLPDFLMPRALGFFRFSLFFSIDHRFRSDLMRDASDVRCRLCDAMTMRDAMRARRRDVIDRRFRYARAMIILIWMSARFLIDRLTNR